MWDGHIRHPEAGSEHRHPLPVCTVRLPQGDIASDGMCPGWKLFAFPFASSASLRPCFISLCGRRQENFRVERTEQGFLTTSTTNGQVCSHEKALSHRKRESSSAHPPGASFRIIPDRCGLEGTSQLIQPLHHPPRQGQAETLTATKA